MRNFLSRVIFKLYSNTNVGELRWNNKSSLLCIVPRFSLAPGGNKTCILLVTLLQLALCYRPYRCSLRFTTLDGRRDLITLGTKLSMAMKTSNMTGLTAVQCLSRSNSMFGRYKAPMKWNQRDSQG